jgi:hypothetical protein
MTATRLPRNPVRKTPLDAAVYLLKSSGWGSTWGGGGWIYTPAQGGTRAYAHGWQKAVDRAVREGMIEIVQDGERGYLAIAQRALR